MSNRYKSSGGRSNIVKSGRTNVSFKKSTVYDGQEKSGKARKSVSAKKKSNGPLQSFLSIFVEGWQNLNKSALLRGGIGALIFAAVGICCAQLLPVMPAQKPAVGRLITELIFLAVAVALTVAYSLITKEKFEAMLQVRPRGTQGYIESDVTTTQIKGIGLGILYGAIVLGGTIAILRMYLALVFEEQPAQVDDIIIWALAILAHVLATELIAHGIVFCSLRKNLNFAVAAFFSAVAFIGINAGTAFVSPFSFFSMLAMSIFFSAAMDNSGSIGTPIFTYYIWLCIGGLIFGVVRLPADYPHMFTPTFNGSFLLSGGDAKLDGSLIVLLINIMFIFSFYGKWVKEYKEKEDAKAAAQKHSRKPEEVGEGKVRIGGRIYPNVDTYIGQKTRYSKKSWLQKIKDAL